MKNKIIDWDFIERYYPNYYRADEILENDLLLKYIDGELDDEEDKERFKRLYKTKKSAKFAFKKSSEYIMEKANEAYQLHGLKKFTDNQLIVELRRRKNVFDVWSLNDINGVISDMKEDDSDYESMNFTEDQKMEILKSMFEDNDKSDDFAGLRQAIIEKFNELNI